MRKDQKTRRRIGTLEVAERLHCHPMTVPRLVKERRLPPPEKLLSKNVWFEDEIDTLVEKGLPPPRHDQAQVTPHRKRG
jgi:hypothetical protein